MVGRCLQAGRAILEKARSKEVKKLEVRCEGQKL
jgi:hypothetical protein